MSKSLTQLEGATNVQGKTAVYGLFAPLDSSMLQNLSSLPLGEL